MFLLFAQLDAAKLCLHAIVGLNDEFICKVAETPEEVSELIEAGFDYVTDLEGKKFFRKRK